MEEKKEYLMLKAGKSTYFFNIRKAKNGTKFLAITQSRVKKGTDEWERSSVMIFPEQIKEFLRLAQEAGERILKKE